jgi:hypothetical protein
MRRLSETADSFGYLFAVHDQYRDYYYNCKSFDFGNATMNADGTYPYCTDWFGGEQTFLCAKLAPDYVKKNYDEFERLGIKLKGAYLDVFSVAELDECFDPSHPMTREECAEYRGRCFSILTSRGLIPSSEEPCGWAVKHLSLCHHAPYFTSSLGSSEAESVGIPIPLFNLVYHDCVVVPWTGGKGERGGDGMPENDSPYSHAVLNANPIYCPIDASAEKIEEVKRVCEISEKLALCEMVSHEFISDDMRRQRTTFSDGTVIEVDFDTEEYTIKTV